MTSGRVQVRVVAPLVIATDDAGLLHYHYEGPALVDLAESDALRLEAEGLVEIVGAVSVPRHAAEDRDVIFVDDTDESAEPEVDDDAAGRPPQVAPKAEWVAYATRRGIDQSSAEEMTKAELIAALS